MTPRPTRSAYEAGKEYGNTGQCNPTYFTVGNLVNHLKDLRDRQGVPTERLVNDYVPLAAALTAVLEKAAVPQVATILEGARRLTGGLV